MHERHQQYLAHLSDRADAAVARHGLKGVRAEVVLVLDVSKSMYAMYKSNMVAELATRLLALSLEFDDDGVIPAYAFGDRCRHLGDLRVDDFPNWVEREVIRTGADFQNHCNYAPVIHEVCSYFFPEDWRLPTREVKVGRIFKKKKTLYPTLSAPRALPVYALFVTSGDCQDQVATTDAVRRSSRLPIFWQFIGLQSGKGPHTKFSYLEKLDTLGNTHVDNCGFFEVTDTRNDASIFEGMVKEFPSYLARPEVGEMLLPAEEGGRTTKGERGHGDEIHGQDTAMRMAYDDSGEAAAGAATAAEQARRRKLAEARALERRAARSQVMPKAREADGAEPTAALSPLASRTFKASSDTRTNAAPIEGTKSRPAIDARALRAQRRQAVEARSPALPDDIEAAQAQLARHVERTEIRSSADEDEHAEYEYQDPGLDEGVELADDAEYEAHEAVEYEAHEHEDELEVAPEAYEFRPIGAPTAEHTRTQLIAAEPTSMLPSQDDGSQSAEDRLRAIRARRAARHRE